MPEGLPRFIMCFCTGKCPAFVKVYLDKTEEFTHVVLRPKITLRNGDGAKVRRALDITQKYSLIAASIKSDLVIEPRIIIEGAGGD